MLIDELIEKAFSDGYEYALMEQREFAGYRQIAPGEYISIKSNLTTANNNKLLQSKRVGNPSSKASRPLPGPSGLR